MESGNAASENAEWCFFKHVFGICASQRDFHYRTCVTEQFLTGLDSRFVICVEEDIKRLCVGKIVQVLPSS